ncbi:MAG: hypothetical protein A2Y71_03030 [Bacteroidetes bacterium RBG_13_42_15]|nr:MAG: hypothetical protein A2Y71_03030 [Bacteroidetes bacterium RBG_13_42_15]
MKPTEKKQLKYDYSELDKFLNKEIDPKGLAKELRDLHCCLTDTLAQLITMDAVSDGWSIRQVEIYTLEDFFQILDRLQPNEGGAENEN